MSAQQTSTNRLDSHFFKSQVFDILLFISAVERVVCVCVFV